MAVTTNYAEPGNKELLNIVVAATNEKGFYVSEIDHRCFPIVVNDIEIKVIDIDSKHLESGEFWEGKVSNYGFKIHNLLPKDLSGTDIGNINNCYKVVKKSGFAVLEKDGKLYAHEMNGSSFGGGCSDGFRESAGRIVCGYGLEIKEIPEDAHKMVGDAFINIKGQPIGKDEGCVILSGTRNGNGVMRYKVSDKNIAKAVPGKKSHLFKEIETALNAVEILAKVAFTTANGLTICDPVRILDRW